MTKSKAIIPIESIQQRIFEIRELKIIVDTDLANFYGVETKRLNEQVKRNPDRFPEDLFSSLLITRKLNWSQIATTSLSSNILAPYHTLLLNMEQ